MPDPPVPPPGSPSDPPADASRPPLLRRIVVPLVVLGLLAAAGLGGYVAVREAVPKLTEEDVDRAVVTTIQREAPASFLVTGTLDVATTVTLRNAKTVLPGLLDLSLGTSEVTLRVPGRVAYGFDTSGLTADHVRLAEDGVVEVAIPDLAVFSAEPDLARLDVQTGRGWARSASSVDALRTEALGQVQGAMRSQGQAHLNRSPLQPRANTARALEALLRPALAAAGLPNPRFRFALSPTIRQGD